jgi:hypothetical protein
MEQDDDKKTVGHSVGSGGGCMPVCCWTRDVCKHKAISIPCFRALHLFSAGWFCRVPLIAIEGSILRDFFYGVMFLANQAKGCSQVFDCHDVD